jgi:ubiquinone/menaquinone biosynthesis C-methylase UbiE
MSNFIKRQLEQVYTTVGQIEFKHIQRIIDLQKDKNEISFLDAGSGFCTVPIYFSKKNKNIRFSCVDLNDDLVELAKSHQFNAFKSNVLELPFEDNSFDIVHCSHVIEHLRYPEVIDAIHELFRVCKPDGMVIIRTPLRVNHRFYNDIDHIRPYPPDAILNYFKNQQQQRVGTFQVEELTRWYTRVYYEFDPNRHPYAIVKIINQLMKLSWLFVRFPFARPNNYGIVLKKK